MNDAVLVPNQCRRWERLEHETELAWEAFCKYLRLTIREGKDRRILQDLADQEGKKLSQFSKWASAFNWEERAKAYDTFMAFHPHEIVELKERRELAGELRLIAKELRSKGRDAVSKIKTDKLKLEDAVKLIKLSVELDDKANKIAEPEVEGQRDKLKSDIRGVIEQLLTGGMGTTIGGSPSGVITATERTVSIDLGGSERVEQVHSVPAIPGEVREGDIRFDVVGGADGVIPSGEGQSKGSLQIRP